MRTTALTPEIEVKAIRKLYEILPAVGVENTNINANNIARDINLTASQATRIVRRLESAGILSRRISFSGRGKESYWKLLLPLNEAIEKIQTTIVPLASMRGRILAAIEKHGQFNSSTEILEYIRKPGENLDPHNITHVLRTLRQQGKVAFKQTKNNRLGVPRGKYKEGIPYAISGGSVIETPNSSPELVALPEPEPRPSPEPMPTPIMETSEFPLIVRLAQRRGFLEQAAFLADEGDAKEIATMLLEAAENSKLSPFEQEVMNLWNAYKECKGN